MVFEWDFQSGTIESIHFIDKKTEAYRVLVHL